MPTRRSTYVCLAALSGLFFVSSSAAAAPWASGTPLPSPLAQGAATVDSKGEIHVVGGYSTSSNAAVSDHEVLQADGGWADATALPVAARAGVAIASPTGRVYFVGGFSDTQGGDLGTAYAYETDGGWTTLPSPEAPPGWETSGDIGADGKIYVFGGEGPDPDGGATISPNARTQIFDPVSGSWSQGARMPVGLMQHRVLRGSDGRFYVIGGEAGGTDRGTSAVYIYDPTTNAWSNGPALVVDPPSDAGVDAGDAGDAGDGGVAVLLNSFAAVATADRTHFIVAGGSSTYSNGDEPYYDSVFVFDVAAQKWSRYEPALPLGRRELSAAVVGCTLSVLGGSNGATVAENDTNTAIMDAFCATSTSGPKCIADAIAHCGCLTTADCGSGKVCGTTSHVCEAAPAPDGGSADGGTSSDGGLAHDGGTLGGSDGGASNDDGGVLTGDDGDASSGCSCREGREGDASSFLWSGLVIAGLTVARARRKKP